jgi:peptidoglycan/xylan/chitin deacetylase (PgdA/CDA1 family)
MPVLCYHAIDPAWRSPLAIAPDVFARQCAWISRHRRVVSLGEVVDAMNGTGRLPHGVVALTFDDGFETVHEHAMPILRRYGLAATVFLVAGTLGSDRRAVDWVDDPPPQPLESLSRSQVLEMREAGFTFGSHSFAHDDLTTLGDDECERDLLTSRELLEDVLGHSVRWLAYPRGRHDERVRRAASRAGFSHAFTLPQGPEPVALHAVPRVGIWPKDGINALRAKTSDWYLRLRTSRACPLARAVRQLGRVRVPA